MRLKGGETRRKRRKTIISQKKFAKTKKSQTKHFSFFFLIYSELLYQGLSESYSLFIIGFDLEKLFKKNKLHS
jgi:hypothetical protein